MIEQDALYVAGGIYLRWLSPTGWTSPYGTASVSTGLGGTFERPAIAVGASGDPVVAFSAANPGESPNTYVKRWSPGLGAWTLLANGSNTDPTKQVNGPALRADKEGRLVRAEYLAGSVVAKLWEEASGWVQVGGPLNKLRASRGIALAIASDGMPVVAWSEDNGASTPSPAGGGPAPAPIGNLLLKKLNR
jgi:hypothetical protein